MQLVLQHCYKLSGKAMFLLLLLRFKPVNNPRIRNFCQFSFQFSLRLDLVRHIVKHQIVGVERRS